MKTILFCLVRHKIFEAMVEVRAKTYNKFVWKLFAHKQTMLVNGDVDIGDVVDDSQSECYEIE